MLRHSLLVLLLCIISTSISYSANENGFSYDDGFPSGVLRLDGVASTTNGALRLTNGELHVKGHAFHGRQFDSISSFSTTFVILISSTEEMSSTDGLAFTLSSSTDFASYSQTSQYLGLFNKSNDADATNQLFAVEFDTSQNTEFDDINDNHVGIDVNSLTSVNSSDAGYYYDNLFNSLYLASDRPIQVWVDYDENSHNLDVTLARYLQSKPQRPLLSSIVNLTSVLPNSVYVGFSSSTGPISSTCHIIGWSFSLNGEAKPLDYSALSKVIEGVRQKEYVGQIAQNGSHIPRDILLSTVIPSAFIALVILIVLYVLRKKTSKNGEWEIDCGPPSFTYKDLATATRGFSDRMLLGKGGFGKVYKGVLQLQATKQNAAIKRVAPDSKQGMKEFIAEITILGHLRHRNLVQFLGYSRHNNELLLVYDYMPNGSLDKVLHDQDRQVLDWCHRLNIIRGIASGLFYLHEDWEKVVIHRDIKTSNVLLDTEMNARLGDFGLARLHNHGTDAHTTHLAGTWGYIAPELARLGRATKATDVFAFGVFMLEVACGRRPIVNDSGDPVLLTDWVLHAWESGSVLTIVDPRLEDYIKEEVELVLKLGLLCSHSEPGARPCMRVVLQYLEKDAPLPDFQPCFFHLTSRDEGFDQYILSCRSVATATTELSGGR
ncbi:L-type lectin-domain containing receptor kinase IV.2-like [Hordeum vulgare]|nr:L-type lectin-domain containing receptor kinase IV.2-like [Hordeum vulgare]